MAVIRYSTLLVLAVFLVGCGGDSGAKVAVPASNPATKPPGVAGEGDAAGPPTSTMDAAE
jgi:hypothetical protein